MAIVTEGAIWDVWVLTVMSAYSEEPPNTTICASLETAQNEMEKSIIAALADKEMNLDPAELFRADDCHAEITGEIAWEIKMKKLIY